MRLSMQLNQLSATKHLLMAYINLAFSKRKHKTVQSTTGPGRQTPRAAFDTLKSLWECFVLLQIPC